MIKFAAAFFFTNPVNNDTAHLNINFKPKLKVKTFRLTYALSILFQSALHSVHLMVSSR